MQQNPSISRILITIASIVIILAGVKLATEIIIPFLLSLFIAIICSPIIKLMTDRKVPLWLAITLLFVLFILVSFFLAGLINSTIREFTLSIPSYKILLAQRISDLLQFAEKWGIPLSVSRESIMNELDPSRIMNMGY